VLSVVIATKDSEHALVATLAALVPGAADGLIRDVIIVDAGSSDKTLELADGAGCRVLPLPDRSAACRLKAAAAAARGPWLMFLRPGIVPDPIWIAEVSRFIERAPVREAGRRAAVFRASLDPDSSRPVLAEALALLRSALGILRPAQGLIIAKHFYDELGGHDTAATDCEADFLRRLGRRRITLLRCGAIDMSE
jgi:glycosyltransferase involved in cell wall biosynthesis